MNYRILTGDNRLTLKTIADNTIDAIVTDPPYGIDFLGKAWDANTGALETYQECLRVLKPGGHIVAFSAARTYHHLAVTLEQAGFEIRDQIMWIYSSGFPKSQDVGKSIDRSAGKKNNLKRHDSKKKDNNGLDMGSGVRCPGCGKDSAARYSCDKGNDCGMVYKPQTKEAEQWAGWGTALKPAHEPICLARKPMKLSIAKNCQEWGVGALNIDATRVPYAEDDILEEWKQRYPDVANGTAETHANFSPELQGKKKKKSDKQKIMDWANRYTSPGMQEYAKLDGSAERTHTKEQYKPTASPDGRFPSNVIGDIPDYQKYFYCPKVSRRERHIGFDDDTTMNNQQWLDLVGGKWCNEDGSMGPASKDGANMCFIPGKGKIYVHGLRHEVEEILRSQGRESEIPEIKGNNHPTVKPIDLMRYLIKLITPAGGTVLDPFTGSGSTGCAAVELGHTFVGCELDPAYVEIARTRIEAWNTPAPSGTTFEDFFE